MNNIYHVFFNVNNMGDYHDYYLKKNFLLLTDVFEKFTSEPLKFYKLDPSHYFSSPGLIKLGCNAKDG